MTEQYLQPHASDRLLYRPITSDIIVEWKEFLDDDSSTLFFPESFKADTQMAEKWIQGQLIRYVEGRFGLLGAYEKESGDFVGQIGLISQVVEDEVELEIGYHLMPEKRGLGYATEGAIYFKEYAKAHTPFKSVISLIHPENKPSQDVAKRNDMQTDGNALHHGVNHDIWRFSFS